MKFHLSRRQLKELQNGKTIRVAIPYPDGGIPGSHRHHDGSGAMGEAAIRRWVDQHLVIESQSEYDYAVEIADVPVNPLRRGAGLAAVFGTIESLGSDRLTLRVVCVVVEIAARRAPRANYPTQWPGSVTLDDGRTLP